MYTVRYADIASRADVRSYLGIFHFDRALLHGDGLPKEKDWGKVLGSS
jgi:hypothetical protein